MSTKFSHSPALHLQIGRSRHWHALQALYFLAALLALGLIALHGRPELATLLGLALICSLPRLLGQPAVGVVLHWSGGRWTLDDGAGAKPIELRRGCRVTPWVVLLSWQGPGPDPGRLWVFADAVDPASWRRLRVRLRLQG